MISFLEEPIHPKRYGHPHRTACPALRAQELWYLGVVWDQLPNPLSFLTDGLPPRHRLGEIHNTRERAGQVAAVTKSH